MELCWVKKKLNLKSLHTPILLIQHYWNGRIAEMEIRMVVDGVGDIIFYSIPRVCKTVERALTFIILTSWKSIIIFIQIFFNDSQWSFKLSSKRSPFFVLFMYTFLLFLFDILNNIKFYYIISLLPHIYERHLIFIFIVYLVLLNSQLIDISFQLFLLGIWGIRHFIYINNHFPMYF